MTITEEDMERISPKQDLILSLKNEREALQKKVEFLQGKCRKAGQAILDQELTIHGLKKEIDRLSDENDNLRIILKGKQNGKE